MRKVLLVFLLCCSFLVQLKAQKPVLTIPTGQTAFITAFKVTPNAKYLLSASIDRSIKVYELKSKKEVFTFLGHKDFVSAITIAADNRTVFSGDENGNIIKWDLNTGKVLETEIGTHHRRITDLDLSADGKLLLSADMLGIIETVDVSRENKWVFTTVGRSFINKANFTKNGKLFFSVSPDTSSTNEHGNLVLRKADTTIKMVKSIRSATSRMRSASLSVDEQSIYYITESPAKLYQFDLQKDSIVFSVDLEKMKPLDILTMSDKKLLIIGRGANSGAVFNEFDIAQQKIKSIATDIYIEDGLQNWISMQNYPGKPNEIIYITGVEQRICHLNLNNYTNEILNHKEAVTPSKPVIIWGNIYLTGDKVLNKWSIENNWIDVVHREEKGIYELVQQTLHILVSCYQKWLVWDVESGKVIKTIPEPIEGMIPRVFISPDMDLIAVPLSNKTIKIYDAQTYNLIKTLTIGFDFNYQHVVWQDNHTLTFTKYQGEKTIFFFDLDKGLLPQKIQSEKNISKFAKINEEHYLAGLRNGNLVIFDRKTNVIVAQRKFDMTEFNLLRFDHNLGDSGQVILGTDLGDILFLNPTTLVTEKTFKGHKNRVVDVEFEDYKRMYSTSWDKTLKIWDLKTDQEIVSTAVLGKNSGVVFAQNGLFEASPMAMKSMYYVANDSTDLDEPWKVIALDQLKHRYYQPGLLHIKMGYSKEPLRVVSALENIELAPKLKSTLVEDHILHLELKNQKGGIGKVVVFINKAEVLTDARPNRENDKNLQALTIDVDLNAYNNRFADQDTIEIKIVAWNGGNWLSSTPEIINYNAIKSKGVALTNNAPKKVAEKPRLFALVFGTSDYSGTQIDLRYAGKDAADFASALKISAQQLFGVSDVEVNLFNSEATDPAHQPDKKNLISTMEGLALKMKPSDILVVYLSGHGVNFGGADGDFYYLTKDAAGADAAYLADPAVRNIAAVSSAELTALLNKITAKKKMLILDACASGKAAETMLAAARDVPASQVRALDRMQDRTGFYILSGSASDAVSYESSVYGQGLLTYSLLKAMRGAALRIDGGEEYIDIQKLLQYAVDEVPKLAEGIGGIQKPLYRSPDNQQSFDIGKTTEQTKNAIILAEPKPVFVAVGLQDPIELFDKLNLSEKINAAIRENTAKGKNADFVFTEAKDYPGAYRISGTYEQKGNELTLKYVLIKDKIRIGEVRLFSSVYTDPAVFAGNFIKALKESVTPNVKH